MAYLAGYDVEDESWWREDYLSFFINLSNVHQYLKSDHIRALDVATKGSHTN